MGTFMYPRTISVTRPNAQQGIGLQAYGGLSPNAETPVAGAQGWLASIQLAKATKGNLVGLPSDVNLNEWKILVFRCPAGIVQNADVITDDFGRRFKVDSAYVDSMGANFYCTLLEV